MTPLALELARLCFVSLGGDDAIPWTAESTLVSGSDMLMIGSEVWWEVSGGSMAPGGPDQQGEGDEESERPVYLGQ